MPAAELEDIDLEPEHESHALAALATLISELWETARKLEAEKASLQSRLAALEEAGWCYEGQGAGAVRARARGVQVSAAQRRFLDSRGAGGVLWRAAPAPPAGEMRADIRHRRPLTSLSSPWRARPRGPWRRASEHARHRSRRALQLAARNFFAEEDDCREEHDDSLRASRGRGQGTSRGARHNGRALSPWQNWSPPVTPGSGGRAPESPSAWARAHAPVQRALAAVRLFPLDEREPTSLYE